MTLQGTSLPATLDFPQSAALGARASQVIPGGVNSGRRKIDPPLSFQSGKGARIVDTDGRTYVDFHAAYSAVLLGHSDPRVVEAVTSTIGDQLMFSVGASELEVEVAEKIVARVPSIDQVLLCNSGSEATYHAIRLARGTTGRQKIIKFQGCYHGFHDYALRNVHSRRELVGQRDPVSAGSLDAAIDSTLVCRYNDLDDVAQQLERNEGEVAAILVEPIAHNAPAIMPQPGFLEGLRKLADQHGAVLVFDEVITGFRHHVGGYQTIAGVTPDLTTMGKAIANGFPVAALGGRRELMEAFNTVPDGPVFYGGTYNGNAVGLAAISATLDVLDDGTVHEKLFRLGDRMRDGLREISARVGVETTVAGYGSIFLLCFMPGPITSYEDCLANDEALFRRYRWEMISRGFFEFPDKFGRSHILDAHTDDDVDAALQAAEESLRAAVDASAPRSG